MTDRLEYGTILMFKTNDFSLKNNYFFLNRIRPNELELIKTNGDIIQVDIDIIEEIIIVYKPELSGYCKINQLKEGMYIELEFENEDKIKGEIKEIVKEVITLESDKKDIYYIPVLNGLPDKILNIKQISKPIENTKKIYKEVALEKEEIVIDEIIQFENEEYNIDYTLEQQKEDLLDYFFVKDKSKKEQKKIYKNIQRYKELFFNEQIEENKIYDWMIPVTSTIKMKYLNVEDEEKEQKEMPSFCVEVDPVDFFTKEFKETSDYKDIQHEKGKHNLQNIPFQKYDKISNNPFTSIINEKGTTKDNYTLNSKEVYLLDELVLINMYDPFYYESYIVRNKPYFYYSKINQKSCSILEQCNLSRHPYMDFLFNSNVLNIEDKNTNHNLKLSNDNIWFRNECTNFEEYEKKIIPDMFFYFKTYLNTNFVNVQQFYREIEYFNKTELEEDTIEFMKKYMIKNLEVENKKITNNRKGQTDYKKIYDAKEKIYSKMVPNYFNIKNTNTFYSISELMKYTFIDGQSFMISKNVEDADLNMKIDDKEIQELLQQIETNKEEYKIDKYYEKQYQLEDDNGKIVLKDIENLNDKMYNTMLEKTNMKKTKEDFEKEIKDILINGFQKINNYFVDEQSILIETLIKKYKIYDGNKAEVKETKELYTWTQNEWVKEGTQTCKFNFVRLKGKCIDDLKKEDYYKNVKELVDQYKASKLKDLSLSEQDKYNIHKKLIYLQKMSLLHNLKYNNEKIMLYQKGKEYNDYKKQSPYYSLFVTILKEQNLNIKYKALKEFISRYTKQDLDQNWFSCIDTETKLVPKFLLELADAYLVSQNYIEKVNEITERQGVMSDTREHVVDKYSGYIIKRLEFEEIEMYTDSGSKDIHHSIIENEEIIEDEKSDEEKKINNALLHFLSLMGISLLEKDKKILYDDIFKRISFVSPSKVSVKQKNEIIVYCIISHCLLYVQINKEENYKLIKGFPGCKKSFIGFPQSKDETKIEGLTYVCCIAKNISKNIEPWNSLHRLDQDKLIQKMIHFIKKYILIDFFIRKKLEKSSPKQITKKNDIKTVWDHFLPRLIPIEVSPTPIETSEYYSFRLIQLINTHISKQKPLLLTSQLNPYYSNYCCQDEVKIYNYMNKHIDLEKEIRNIEKSKKVKSELQHLYSVENTKLKRVKVDLNYDKNTIYKCILKWFLFDGSQNIPKELEQFNVKKPEDYKKTDTIMEKIKKMSIDNDVNEMTFLEIMKTISKINKSSKNKVDKEVKEIDHLEKLYEKGYDSLYDYCITENETMKKDIVRKLKTTKEKKKMTTCLETNKFVKKYVNHYTEHNEYSHKNNVLKNKIHSLINIFPEQIKKTKSNTMIKELRQKINSSHLENIYEYLNNYYKLLSSFKEDDTLYEAYQELKETTFKRYNKLLELTIPNSKVLNVIYEHIYIHIFYDYMNEPLCVDFIKKIMEIFINEDVHVIHFDKEKIDYLAEMSKKSEIKLKTDQLKELSKEGRRSQNKMKELKLGEWSVGLEKGIFKYDKNIYNEVYEEAKLISGEFEPLTEETYGPIREDMEEMDDNLDGDEFY